jgi:hypothetical protein
MLNPVELRRGDPQFEGAFFADLLVSLLQTRQSVSWRDALCVPGVVLVRCAFLEGVAGLSAWFLLARSRPCGSRALQCAGVGRHGVSPQCNILIKCRSNEFAFGKRRETNFHAIVLGAAPQIDFESI